MKNLKRLELSSNKLKHFPLDICMLPNVDAVDLSNNSISTLPDDVKSLKAIELNLNKNRLRKLNDGLCSCERLKVMRVEENCLTLNSFSEAILKTSQISLLAFDGNTFNMKQFQDLDGYEEVCTDIYLPYLLLLLLLLLCSILIKWDSAIDFLICSSLLKVMKKSILQYKKVKIMFQSIIPLRLFPICIPPSLARKSRSWLIYIFFIHHQYISRFAATKKKVA